MQAAMTAAHGRIVLPKRIVFQNILHRLHLQPLREELAESVNRNGPHNDSWITRVMNIQLVFSVELHEMVQFLLNSN